MRSGVRVPAGRLHSVGRVRARAVGQAGGEERIGAVAVGQPLVALGARGILAVAVGDGGRGEAEHVALDRELRQDAVLLLHVHVAEVRVEPPVVAGAVGAIWQLGSELAFDANAHELHDMESSRPEFDEFSAQPVVPRGGSKVCAMKA